MNHAMARIQDRSDPHRRTRRDHATETAEDYVEAIADISRESGQCRVVDLSSRFAVSHVTVTRIVARLRDEGWVKTAPYRPITLTAKGTRLAEEAKRRHAIVYQFLIAVGVDERIAAIDAEGIEHHVSPETLTCFKRFTADQIRGGAHSP
jgi:DtxR family manganese transport transcriptional regulator